MIKLLPLINETIYGENAVVYHRTRIDDLANRIYTNGFKTGGGNMYGTGFYATYELESQLRPNMRDNYGSTIIKCSCSTNGFFFFDWPEFKKKELCKKLKCTEDDFIFKQLDHFKIRYVKEQLTKIINTASYSSEIAGSIFSSSTRIHNVAGIIFTGKQDGQTLVSYDVKRIIPLSYTTDEGNTWSKVDVNVTYMKRAIDSKNSSGIDRLLSIYNIENYTFNSDGSIDVDGDVDLSERMLDVIPFKFNKISGNFNCDGNNLRSMKNMPRYVGKSFDCHSNYITNLSGGPTYVGLDYDCRDNLIQSFDGIPRVILGDLHCSSNRIISMVSAPGSIRGNFEVWSNHISSLEGLPSIVGGYIDIRKNKVKFEESDIRAICKVKGEVYV